MEFVTLEKMTDRVRGASNRKFFCLDCKRDLTSILHKIPNDQRTYTIQCPRCKRVKNIDAGLLAFVILTKTETRPHD